MAVYIVFFGDTFHEQFLIVFQIWLKFDSALIKIVVKRPLWNFAHDPTLVLSRKEQKL